MLGQRFAAHFRIDLALEVTQRIDAGKIHVAAIDEGLQLLEQLRAQLQITGYGARLDQRIALPFAPVHLVVVLHRRKGHRRRAGLAEGPQPPVHPVDEALGGAGGEDAGEVLGDTREIAVGVQRFGAVGFTALAVAEDQVYVGGKIQLAAAQLAHADDHRLDQITGTVARQSVLRLALLLAPDQRGLTAGLGQLAQVRQAFVQRREPGQIAQRDAQHFLIAAAAQGFHQARLVGRRLQMLLQPGLQLADPVAVRHAALFEILLVTLRVHAQLLGHEFAGGQNPRQRAGQLRRLQLLRIAGRQLLQFRVHVFFSSIQMALALAIRRPSAPNRAVPT